MVSGRKTFVQIIMNIFNIKHWLQTKIYHACENVKKERETKILNDILSKMTFQGTPLQISNGYHISGSQYMEFGDNCWIGQNAWIECLNKWKNQSYIPKLKVGRNFNMAKNSHIGCIESIEIGNDVLLGSKVYITDHFHGEILKDALDLPPIERPLISKPVKIGNQVWIGDNVCIMPGITLGNNVIVGANAVVTHSFPDNCVIAGVPAKVIKTL